MCWSSMQMLHEIDAIRETKDYNELKCKCSLEHIGSNYKVEAYLISVGSRHKIVCSAVFSLCRIGRYSQS